MALRGRFTTNAGFLLAAIGSVVGMGSIWRFPYIAYANGGGAFLIPYFIALLTAGIPLLLLEYGLGHKMHASSPLAFAKISLKVEWLGWWMPLFVTFGILFYYQVVIGWCGNFLVYALSTAWGADSEGFFLNTFLGLTSAPEKVGGLRWPIVASTAAAWFVTWAVTFQEVHRGIERTLRVFMPVLLVTTLILVGWGLTLPGASEGLKYYLTPRWDKLLDVKVWLAAYSQIFFSFSLAFGVMIAYASYLPRRADLVQNAWITSLSTWLYSLVAGVAVFSVLGYLSVSKGLPIEYVVKSGPTLAFVVFPEAISNLPWLREAFGVCFFFALMLAGLASAVAMVETFVVSVQDKFGWPRKTVVTVLVLVGMVGSLLYTTGSGLHWLVIVDRYLNQYGLVLAGLLECLVIGFGLKAGVVRDHINRHTRLPMDPRWDFMVKFLTPALLLVMLVRSLWAEIAHGFGSYRTLTVLAMGGGWLLLTLLAAWWLARRPWDPQRLRTEHQPAEDELFR
ncbi:MAG: sodium-dependent transporter [candidate division FCPU426 bacterium]